MVNIEPIDTDPCAGMDPISKKICEAEKNLVPGGSSLGGSGSSGSGSSGVSLWSLITNPTEIIGGIRHVFTRIAEVLIGGLLVIIGLNSLIKSETGVSVSSTATKAVKTVGKVVK